MLNKLQTLYPNAILYSHQPHQTLDGHCLFFDATNKEWIAIPKKDLGQQELQLLQTLYESVEPTSSEAMAPFAKSWFEFLFLNGQQPRYDDGQFFRLIQFQMNGNPIDATEMELALNGFFSDDILILWENNQSGILVEQQKHKASFLAEKEWLSMTETLESDFYTKIYFYIGKPHLLTDDLPSLFETEQEYFYYGQTRLSQLNVFTFEKIFPYFLASHLPEAIEGKLTQTIAEAFSDDPEMLHTIKVFLENNLNASVTAKKLYIHRNTLQYRIDKFTDKTGIQLKDFYGAFSVFLACLLIEQSTLNNMPK